MVVMNGGVACQTQPSPSAATPLPPPPPPPPVTTSSSGSWYDHQTSASHQQQQLHDQQHHQQHQQGHHHHQIGDGGGSAELAAADAYFKGQQSYFSQMQQYQGMSHGADKNSAVIPISFPSQVLVIRDDGNELSLNLVLHLQRNRR